MIFDDEAQFRMWRHRYLDNRIVAIDCTLCGARIGEPRSIEDGKRRKYDHLRLNHPGELFHDVWWHFRIDLRRAFSALTGFRSHEMNWRDTTRRPHCSL
jgi:hypothetical protein